VIQQVKIARKTRPHFLALLEENLNEEIARYTVAIPINEDTKLGLPKVPRIAFSPIPEKSQLIGSLPDNCSKQ
jgi:hypothetical protein